jgi:hypothetical protein
MRAHNSNCSTVQSIRDGVWTLELRNVREADIVVRSRSSKVQMFPRFRLQTPHPGFAVPACTDSYLTDTHFE